MTKRDYEDPAYKEFRMEVLARDHKCCQWPRCGSTRSLHVHHIRTWAKHPSLRYDVRNGITLCKQHHDDLWGKEEIYERLLSSIAYKNRKEYNGNTPRRKGSKRTITKRAKKEIARARSRKKFKQGFRASKN